MSNDDQCVVVRALLTQLSLYIRKSVVLTESHAVMSFYYVKAQCVIQLLLYISYMYVFVHINKRLTIEGKNCQICCIYVYIVYT